MTEPCPIAAFVADATCTTDEFWSLMKTPRFVRIGEHFGRIEQVIYYCAEPPDEAYITARMLETHAELDRRGDEEPWEIDWRKVFLKGLPWLLSLVTIYMNVLAGNKDSHAWAWGLVGQAGWLTWILVSKSWGFLPMNIALWIVYARNCMLWL